MLYENVTYEDMRDEEPAMAIRMRAKLASSVYRYIGKTTRSAVRNSFECPDLFEGRDTDDSVYEFNNVYPYWRSELIAAGFNMIHLEHLAQMNKRTQA